MKKKNVVLLGVASTMLVTVSCMKVYETPGGTIASPSTGADAMARTSTLTHPGRTLAANCFQCHGTDGYAGELKIAGMGYSELSSKLSSFRAKDPKSDIMNFHSQAFTAEEINLVADYFSKQ